MRSIIDNARLRWERLLTLSEIFGLANVRHVLRHGTFSWKADMDGSNGLGFCACPAPGR